ncbi:low temperature requirement protein A [Actinocorallia lasiicapitis]
MTPHEEITKVSTLELFFDLVFVFIITQLTGVLVHRTDPVGLFQAVIQFALLWWMYGGYAWLTNTVPLTTVTRRLLMFAGMAGYLVIALAAPTAFDGGGVAWGVGYLIVVLVHGGLYAQVNRNIMRMLPVNAAAALLVILAGVVGEGPAVPALWIAALLVHLVVPRFFAPTHLFQIRAPHIVERHGLLVIIALGESVIAIGIGAGDHTPTAGLVVAAVLGLALVGQLWWLYFDTDDEKAEQSLHRADSASRTSMTLAGFYNAHLPILVGIIVLAAGLENVLHGPWHGLHGGQALLLGGGTALFLAGDVWYRRIMGIGPSWPRLAAAGLALASVPIGLWLATAEMGALLIVLAGLLIVESRLGQSGHEGLGVERVSGEERLGDGADVRRGDEQGLPVRP